MNNQHQQGPSPFGQQIHTKGHVAHSPGAHEEHDNGNQAHGAGHDDEHGHGHDEHGGHASHARTPLFTIKIKDFDFLEVVDGLVLLGIAAMFFLWPQNGDMVFAETYQKVRAAGIAVMVFLQLWEHRRGEGNMIEAVALTAMVYICLMDQYIQAINFQLTNTILAIYALMTIVYNIALESGTTHHDKGHEHH